MGDRWPNFSPNYLIHSAFIPSNIIKGNGFLSIKFTNLAYNSGRVMGIVGKNDY
jgi:hypothetical protein